MNAYKRADGYQKVDVGDAAAVFTTPERPSQCFETVLVTPESGDAVGRSATP